MENNNEAMADLVNKCIRFFLLHAGPHVPIKKTQLVKHVFSKKSKQTFDITIQKASEILNTVYGLNIDAIDSGTTNKTYIVTNKLKFAELLDNPKYEDMKLAVMFLVLTHIFMSDNLVTEFSIWKFLEHFKITVSTNIKDIGNAHVFIKETMFEQQYLEYYPNGKHVKNSLMKKKIRWGIRAEKSVSKMEIIQFVAKMYNKPPNTWPVQFEAAQAQLLTDE